MPDPFSLLLWQGECDECDAWTLKHGDTSAPAICAHCNAPLAVLKRTVGDLALTDDLTP